MPNPSQPYQTGPRGGYAPGAGMNAGVQPGGGGGGAAPLVAFRSPDVHPWTGTTSGGGIPGQSGGGGGAAGAPAAGTPGGLGAGALGQGSLPADFLDNPTAGYQQAAAAAGWTLNPDQQAILNYGPGGAAFVQDRLGYERQGRQEQQQSDMLGAIRGGRSDYLSGENYNATNNLVNQQLNDPNAVSDQARQMMLAIQNSSIAGGAQAQRQRLADATGGAGGAFVGGMGGIARNQQLAGLGAQHQGLLDQLLNNFQSRQQAAGLGMQQVGQHQGILGNYRSDELNTLNADIGVPNLSGATSVAGLQQLIAQLRGQGGGPGGGMSAEHGYFPGFNESDHGRLIGGNTSGRVTANFNGVNLDSRGMNSGSGSGGGNSTIGISDGNRWLTGADGRRMPAQDTPGGQPGQWMPPAPGPIPGLGSPLPQSFAGPPAPGPGVGGTSPTMPSSGGASPMPAAAQSGPPPGMTNEEWIAAIMEELRMRQGYLPPAAGPAPATSGVTAGPRYYP